MEIRETPPATKVILWMVLVLLICTGVFFGLWALTRHGSSGTSLRTIIPATSRA